MPALSASPLFRMPVSVTGAAGGAGTPHEGAVSAAVGRWRKYQQRAGRPGVFLYRRGGARPPFHRHQAVQGNRARAALTGISSFRAPRNGELGMTIKGIGADRATSPPVRMPAPPRPARTPPTTDPPPGASRPRHA